MGVVGGTRVKGVGGLEWGFLEVEGGEGERLRFLSLPRGGLAVEGAG